jgi:hypothetical protein
MNALIPLGLKYWREGLILAAIALLVASCHARDVALQDAGAQRERAKALELTLAGHVHEAARLDTVVKNDTVKLTKAVTHFDTLKQTVNIHDTVEVLRTIAAADTAIRVCKATVTDLLLSCAAKDTVIADLRKIIANNVGASVPAAASRSSWVERALWFSLGAEAHQLSIHPPKR